MNFKIVKSKYVNKRSRWSNRLQKYEVLRLLLDHTFSLGQLKNSILPNKTRFSFSEYFKMMKYFSTPYNT